MLGKKNIWQWLRCFDLLSKFFFTYFQTLPCISSLASLFTCELSVSNAVLTCSYPIITITSSSCACLSLWEVIYVLVGLIYNLVGLMKMEVEESIKREKKVEKYKAMEVVIFFFLVEQTGLLWNISNKWKQMCREETSMSTLFRYCLSFLHSVGTSKN